jgi:PAS domain S-box-containing protein
MSEGKAKALDLFLLMLNLSQLSSKETIAGLFVEALSEIWPGLAAAYSPVADTGHGSSLEIANGGSRFGFIALDGLGELDDEGRALVENAVSMLGVLLRKNEQDGIQSDRARRNEERFRTVFENSIVGKSITGIDGSLSTNRAFRRMLGYSEDELSSLRWQDLTHPGDIEADEAIVASLISGESESQRWEKRFLHKDGSSVWVDISTTLQRDGGGKPLFFITSANDVTARKQAEAALRTQTERYAEDLEERVRERTEQLEAANRELEAFSYSVSHDLRAPLRAITGFSHMLVEDYAESLGEEGRRLCSVIDGSAAAMSRLIDDLLDFSRVGRKAMRPARVDMGELAASVFHDLAAVENGARIRFTLRELPPAIGDPNLLRQVWINLLSNAIKFSSRKEEARIELSGETLDEETVYTVSDNGAGFHKADSERLFGVFQRLHDASEFEGTGVGLALVKRIISRHGGRVWAEGEPGKRAAFHFSLPTARRSNTGD